MFYLSRFFFFKQKTAYEMRISDWSSDVCSSDLFQASRVPLHWRHAAMTWSMGLGTGPIRIDPAIITPGLTWFCSTSQAPSPSTSDCSELGRAACREREWLYA